MAVANINRRSELGSDSFERGGQPRSVPDPDAEAYEAMIRIHNRRLASQQSAVQAQQQNPEFGATPPQRKPEGPVDTMAAGIAHVLNGPRQARREVEQGHVVRGLVDGATSAADLTLGRSVVGGIRKGQLKLSGSNSWKATRKWLGKEGLAEANQHMHHAFIPLNKWGKAIPDVIKNQPWNLKATESALHHIRIHGRSLKFDLPRFNAVERYWHGTPTWWKAANASAAGHSVQAIVDSLLGHPQAAPPSPESQKK